LRKYKLPVLQRINIWTVLLAIVQPLFFIGQQDDTLKKSNFPKSVNEIIDLQPEYNADEKISVANLTQINLNEAPGSVYVITSADIEKNAYQDLMDIFLDIPGFNIASDVQNGVSVSLRGMWAEEAKILFMLDGLVMNDMAYGSFIINGRFSLNNIDRIEIIRGAGSSIYGGIAALGAVNIITKDGKKSNGSSLLINTSASNNAISRLGLGFNHGINLLNGINLSASGGIFEGNRSNKLITLSDSSKVNFKDSSLVNDAFVNFRAKYKNLEYKVSYDDYNFQSTYEPISSLARTFNNTLKYTWAVGKITVTPYGTLKRQLPWNTQYGDPKIYNAQNLFTRRLNFGSNFNFDLHQNIKIISGLEYYSDYYRPFKKSLQLSNGKSSDNFNAYAAFAEAEFDFKYARIFAGIRYDKYGYFKQKYSPRISITKDFGTWHYKIIYGESFKIPSLQNINLNPDGDLIPESVVDYQTELGIKHKKTECNVNAFITNINDIIIYTYDLTSFSESYKNAGFYKVGGGEATFKTSFNKFSFNSTYSYYMVLNSNVSDLLADTANLKLGALAIPKHKFTARLVYTINKKNIIGAYYLFQSNKYAQERLSIISGAYGLVKYNSTHNINISYQRKDVLGLFDLTLGVNNLLNTTNYYLYSFSSGYFPMAGMGREIMVLMKFKLQN
jgi:outer membrane cobalamin receptor